MSKVYVIASMVGPSKANVGKYFQAIREMAKEDNVEIEGLKITHGPHCCNVGVCLKEENDKWIGILTMQMMPAKYNYASDAPWVGDIDEL